MATSKRSFLPQDDAGLLAWSLNFSNRIATTPANYGLSAAQATLFAQLQEAYSEAYTTARDPITRTPPNIVAKNDAADALRENARLLAKVVEGTASVTDSMKSALGLTIRKSPSPVPAPTTAPIIDISAVMGRTVKVRMHGEDASRRGRPRDVQGANVFSFVGPTPDDDMGKWKFEGNTTKMMMDIEFAANLAPGSKVWITAFWYNTKAQPGPASAPVGTYIGGGLSAVA